MTPSLQFSGTGFILFLLLSIADACLSNSEKYGIHFQQYI